MFDFSDFDVDCETSGYVSWNKDSNDYVVQVQYLEPIKTAMFTKQDLLHLLKLIEEGED